MCHIVSYLSNISQSSCSLVPGLALQIFQGITRVKSSINKVIYQLILSKLLDLFTTENIIYPYNRFHQLQAKLIHNTEPFLYFLDQLIRFIVHKNVMKSLKEFSIQNKIRIYAPNVST